MSYTPTRWENGKAPALSAENLNKIEDELVLLDEGFEEVNQALRTVQSDVSELKEADATINQTLQTVQNDVEYLKENGGGNGGNVPTKVSQLENDLGYVTSDEIEEEINGLKDADNTINQTLQTIQDDVEELKANGGGGTDNSVDITETTETTMPNSCEGRLLFKEIRGKTEQLTSTGKNVFDASKVVDNKFQNCGSSFGVSNSTSFFVSGLNSVKENTIYTCSHKFSTAVFYSNENTPITTSYFTDGTQFTTPSGSKYVNVCFSKSIVSLGTNIMINEGDTSLPWEPYGVGTPFFRSAVISGIKTHDGNGNESSFTFSQHIELSDSDKIINTGNGFSLIIGETKTELPTADQIALNSLKTFDGTTYLEIDSPLQPEFVAEYGTSKVGGKTLEALAIARNNEIRISALETSAVNNI